MGWVHVVLIDDQSTRQSGPLRILIGAKQSEFGGRNQSDLGPRAVGPEIIFAECGIALDRADQRIDKRMSGLGTKLARRHFKITTHNGVETVGVILGRSGEGIKISVLVQLQRHNVFLVDRLNWQ